VEDEFGVLLRRTRERKLLTQDQLAGRCGLSGRTVRRLETGESAPQLGTLRSLADALDLEPAERDRFCRAAGFGLDVPGATGFGALLQRNRERKLLTQEQLAELSGVSLRAILRLETGDSSLTVTTLQALADTLDLDPTERDEFLLTAMDGRPRLVPEPGSSGAEAAMAFGDLFRLVRLQAGLTQERVAERAMVSLRAVRRLENGERGSLTMATLRSLADALDLDPAGRDGFLLTAADDRPFFRKISTREPAVTVREFGALIRRARMRMGLTQEQVAQRATVSLRAIRRLENGEQGSLTNTTLRSLADALDPDPAERDRFLPTARAGRRLLQ
jgi:transcriptional regulator with XRE-family HTH domain